MTVNKNLDNTINRVVSSLNKMKFVTKFNQGINQNYAVRIENGSNSQELLNDILNDKTLNKTQKADICFSAFLKTQSEEFLLHAAELSKKPLYEFTKLVIGALDHPHEAKGWDWDLLNKSNTKQQSKFFKNLKLTNEEVNNLESLNLIKQDAAFQIYESLKNGSQQRIEIEQKTGWYNAKIKISYDQVFEIKDFAGGKLYGYIPAEYDNATWQNAAGKGYAKGRYGHNGVKIEKGVLELKANEDARLYTQELHKNDFGDFIAILDNKAGHPEISKLISKSTALSIYEDCYHQDDHNLQPSDIEVIGHHYE